MRHDFYPEKPPMSSAQSLESDSFLRQPSPSSSTKTPSSSTKTLSSSTKTLSPGWDASSTEQGRSAGRCYNFPRQAATFVDRDVERPIIIERLLDPRCQFLTLVGPGGIGKTRLAIETAQASARANPQAFADGVYFVNAQPVRSLDGLISAVGDSMGLSSSTQATPRDALLHYVQEKTMLILLDNFEHLAHCATELLTELLEHAPGLKLLVTSRTVLNLREEWLFPVHGLPYPHNADDAADMDDDALLSAYGAVQLFVERAQRVRRGFALDQERAGVLRICQLTEGMPLALELAAAWTKSLSCQAIADEITRSIGFLTTQLRNTPAPHRSVRAVYEQTWSLLAPEEQSVFKKLSVFHGGFQRAAAEAVAGATLPTLSALLDQSLLRREASGRYHIHEMLRQYAAEKLNADPTEAAAARDRHSAYYADLLHAWAPDTTGADQHRIMREIGLELDNIRSAWEHAVRTANVHTIRKAMISYYMFCDFRGRYHEGANALEQALAALADLAPDTEITQTQALLQVYLGWHCIRLGRLEAARAAFCASQAHFDTLNLAPPPGFGTHPALGLALMHLVRGDYADAMAVARGANLSADDRLNQQIASYVMANAEFAQGNYQQAASHAQQAYVLTQETGNRWMMAYILVHLGDIARMLEDYEQARRHYQASYDIKEELDDPEGCAVTLVRLAGVHYLQKSYYDAQVLYQQSLHIYQNINDRGGLVGAQYGLGIVAVAQRAYEQGRAYLQAALNSAAEMRIAPLTLTVLTGAADLFLHTDRRELGCQLLRAVLANPASTHETRQRVRRLLQQQNISDGAAEADAPTLRAGMNALIAAAQTELAAPCAAPVSVAQRSTKERVPDTGERTLLTTPDGILVEPLTDREQEVLELVADGLTNKEIANQLIISAGTVKWYTGQIYGKLGVNKRTQAVARARELALLN